jgi:hypothetical protein
VIVTGSCASTRTSSPGLQLHASGEDPADAEEEGVEPVELGRGSPHLARKGRARREAMAAIPRRACRRRGLLLRQVAEPGGPTVPSVT